jgi:hypothetical protein
MAACLCVVLSCADSSRAICRPLVYEVLSDVYRIRSSQIILNEIRSVDLSVIAEEDKIEHLKLKCVIVKDKNRFK